MKSIKGKISGRVQGVFFRKYTKERAKKLNVNGFVRNEPDGSVYLEAEGDEDKIKEFIKWCHTGPPGANVTAVDIIETELKNYQDFQIKY